jgi:hypothetical protein
MQGVGAKKTIIIGVRVVPATDIFLNVATA